jgi:molecular chaperone GrpE
MTAKKKNISQEENIEEVVKIPVEGNQEFENGERIEDSGLAENRIEALQKQLEEAEAKAAEHLDGWQRAQAEFVNYSMKGDVIRKMLPVLDDLERSLAHRPENDSWADGMELIARKFRSVLEAEGVTRIDAVGQPFDPNFHEAISSEPNEDVESGHVIEVVQNGYMLGERVIRPAMVRVAQ